MAKGKYFTAYFYNGELDFLLAEAQRKECSPRELLRRYVRSKMTRRGPKGSRST